MPQARSNIPASMQIPTVAVAPARRLIVKTRGLTNGQTTRGPEEYEVLAIGWYGQQGSAADGAYLVLDKVHNEVFWVSQSVVETVRAAD